VHDLEYVKLHELHAMLEKMKGCKGSRQCNLQEKDGDHSGMLHMYIVLY